LLALEIAGGSTLMPFDRRHFGRRLCREAAARFFFSGDILIG